MDEIEDHDAIYNVGLLDYQELIRSQSQLIDLSSDVSELKHDSESDNEARPKRKRSGKAKRNDSNARGPQSQYWCFTSYSIKEPSRQDSTYIIYQREVCPDTQREHWQGYVEYPTKRYMRSVQKLLGDPTCHLELRKGTAQQASDYCKKGESRKAGTSFSEHGTLSVQGPVNDFDGVVLRLRDGGSIQSIAAEHPKTFIRYFKGIERYIGLRDSGRTTEFLRLHVCVIFGPTGTGKTRYIHDWCNERKISAYKKSYSKGQPSWWDGYIGQEVITIDDYEGEGDIQEQLRLLGGYGHGEVWPIKGGTTYLSPRYIFYTSNNHPDKWYQYASLEKIQAIRRRYTKIIEMDKPTLYNEDKTLLD